VAVILLAAVCTVAAFGCAGTTRGGGDIPSNPDLIRKEIQQIDTDIRNTEEMYKASLTALQMEEDSDLRRDVVELSMDLELLRARKKALEERLAEIEAEQKG
jgi:hypothetical protein